MEGHILHSWGDTLTAANRFGDAGERLDRAAVLLEETGDREALARVFTSMGRLFRLHGQPERALELYRRALAIQEQTGDRNGIIQSHNAMGVAFTFMENYRRAGESYQRGLDLALETGSERIVDALRGALADNFMNREEYARAAEQLEAVISRGKDALLDSRYVTLAKAYHKLGRREQALAAVEEAIAIRRRQQLHFNQHDALALRAVILAERGRLDEALADVRESMRLVEEQRANTMPADFLKRGYSESVQHHYGVAIHVLIHAGRTAEALAVAEQGRARAFLDLLATRDVSLSSANAAHVAELRSVESSLREQGASPGAFMPSAELLLRTRGAPVPNSSPSLSSRWKANDLELRSFVTAEAYSPVQLAATAARLRSTILSYWVGDDAIYIWVVSRNGNVRAATSRVSQARLSQLISRATAGVAGLAARAEDEPHAGPPETAALVTRGGITLRFAPDARQAWQDLDELLIEPIRAWLPRDPSSRLTIVPHGPLFRLSFSALRDRQGRYLTERHEIHYVPAGAVLEFTQRKRQLPRRTGGYLLVADPTNLPQVEKGQQLAPLPGARDEVANTARLLPAGTASILEGPSATEARVRRELGSHRVIHFATHGVIRDEAPLDSFLALGAASPASGEDGRLTVHDVYGLELAADLVFLSACRSARGKVSGDGVIGMTRSFVFAGTPTVVATLWDVADETTRRLVPQFYRQYLQHTRPGRALREAELQLIADLRAGRVQISTPAGPITLPEDPALWAAFVVFGEP
jgi:CHAT domain-containing protein/tetratricopeptide (TPR) repeat protein